MLEARQLNKVITITEAEKDKYVTLGFDIYEDDKVIEHGHGKTVPYAKYEETLEELAALKAELAAELATETKKQEKEPAKK
ncbi:MAG: hypothetical protein MSC43_02395 [Clostridiales bacterium]|nr:hypothetical protein [Clostridiales bacterium]